VPADWPGGVRHGGDVSLICCSWTEPEKAYSDTSSAVCAGETGFSSGREVRWRTGP